MTRRKVMVYSSGPMEGNTKVDGRMESNTVLVLTHQLVERPSKVNGKKVKDLIGFQVTPKRQANEYSLRLD